MPASFLFGRSFHDFDFVVREAVKFINALVNLAVELLDFRFNRGEVGAAGFGGDGFHQITDGAQIVTRAGTEIDQRFERIDEQRINRLRLFAGRPLFLARVGIQKLPPRRIDELAQRVVLERQPQDRQNSWLVSQFVSDRGRESNFL